MYLILSFNASQCVVQQVYYLSLLLEVTAPRHAGKPRPSVHAVVRAIHTALSAVCSTFINIFQIKLVKPVSFCLFGMTLSCIAALCRPVGHVPESSGSHVADVSAGAARQIPAVQVGSSLRRYVARRWRLQTHTYLMQTHVSRGNHVNYDDTLPEGLCVHQLKCNYRLLYTIDL